jgi:glycerophosphoryl diester phosphodiesterase
MLLPKNRSSLRDPNFDLFRPAHELGLMAHPFTLLSDAGFDECQSFEDLLGTPFNDLKIDGAFTDFPEAVLRFLAQREKKH